MEWCVTASARSELASYS